LDLNIILASVKKTGRLLIVHEANKCCGFGAEIVRCVTEYAFENLVAPPKVLGQIGVPMPFSPVLEHAALPNSGVIVSTAREIITMSSASRKNPKS
jgi:pyruvate/2-oxoglutarate/acetoin dehydrogenase E1 component